MQANRGPARDGRAALVALLLLAFAFTVALSPPQAHAASGLVQQGSTACAAFKTACSGTTLSVSLSGVTAGDVIAVGVGTEGSISLNSVDDSDGSMYTQAVSQTVTLTGIQNNAYLLYADIPPSASGSDIITAMFSTTPLVADLFVYEVSGVTTTGVATGSGSGSSTTGCSTSCTIAGSTSSASFQSGAFILGLIETTTPYPSASAGSGFTLSTENSGSGLSYAEYSTSGVASPTTFPISLSGGSESDWAEVGMALNPPVVTTVTTTVTAVTTTTATQTTTVESTTTVTSTLADLGTFNGADTVASLLYAIQSAVAALQTSVTGIGSGVSGIQSGLASLQSGLNGLTGTTDTDFLAVATGIQNGFATVEGTLATMTSTLSSINSSLGNISTQLSSLQTAVSGINAPQVASGSGVTTLSPTTPSVTIFTSPANAVGVVAVSINATASPSHDGVLTVRYYINPSDPSAYVQQPVFQGGPGGGGYVGTGAAWKVEIVDSFQPHPHPSPDTATVSWAFSAIGSS